MAYAYGQQIWNGLMSDLGNEFGVAAIMGNMKAESSLLPYRKQGDFSSGYTVSKQYTADVDSGVISKSTFINDAIGYGLVQWTFWSLKEDLYDFAKARGTSIGDCDMQVACLIRLLKNSYPSVYNACKNATSIRSASDVFLHDFENPAVQTEAVEIERASFGTEMYNLYSGSVIDPGEPGDPDDPYEPITPTKTKRKNFNFVLFTSQRRRMKNVYKRRFY